MKRVMTIPPRMTARRIDWFRILVTAIATCILCSCSTLPEADPTLPLTHSVTLQPSPNSVPRPPVVPVSFPDDNARNSIDLLSGEAYLAEAPRFDCSCHEPADAAVVCECMDQAGERPRDEYLCDGGDGLYRGSLKPGRERGIEISDTIAQYDTSASRGNVAASNRVCIYAPRFAVARQVIRVEQQEVRTPIGGLHDQTHAEVEALDHEPDQLAHDTSPAGQLGTLLDHSFVDGQRGLLIDDVDVLWEASLRELPLEHQRNVLPGQFDARVGLLVHSAIVAAETWRDVLSVELVIDGRPAEFVSRVGPPSDVYVYHAKSGESKLKLHKTISANAALTGDVIDLAIRFENIGEAPVSNVRIVDNLTTRLEYIEDSQECSRRAIFSSQPNGAGSTKLLWEVRETLEPGENGVVRFRCRVR